MLSGEAFTERIRISLLLSNPLHIRCIEPSEDPPTIVIFGSNSIVFAHDPSKGNSFLSNAIPITVLSVGADVAMVSDFVALADEQKFAAVGTSSLGHLFLILASPKVKTFSFVSLLDATFDGRQRMQRLLPSDLSLIRLCGDILFLYSPTVGCLLHRVNGKCSLINSFYSWIDQL